MTDLDAAAVARAAEIAAADEDGERLEAAALELLSTARQWQADRGEGDVEEHGGETA